MSRIASVDVPTALYSEELSARKPPPEEPKRVSTKQSQTASEAASDSKSHILMALSFCSRAPPSSRASICSVRTSVRSSRIPAFSHVDFSTFKRPHSQPRTVSGKRVVIIKHSDTNDKKGQKFVKPDIAMARPITHAGVQRDRNGTKHGERSVNGTCVWLPKETCLTFLDFSEKRLRTLPCPHGPGKHSCHGSGIVSLAKGRVNPMECVQVLQLSRNKISLLTRPTPVARGGEGGIKANGAAGVVGKPLRLTAFRRVVLLDVSYNELVGLEGVECMVSLRELQASHNRITNLHPLFAPHSLLGSPHALQVLDVSFNAITTILPRENVGSDCDSVEEPQPQLLGLRSLDLSCNFLTELNGVSSLFPNLQKLRVLYNRITEVPPLPKSLHYLSLQKNFLSKPEVRRGMELRGELPHLTLMNLSEQRVPGAEKETSQFSEIGDSGGTSQLCPTEVKKGAVQKVENEREAAKEEKEMKKKGREREGEGKENGKAKMEKEETKRPSIASSSRGVSHGLCKGCSNSKVKDNKNKRDGTATSMAAGKSDGKERSKRAAASGEGRQKLKAQTESEGCHVDAIDEDIIARMRFRAQRKELDVSKALNRDLDYKRVTAARGVDNCKLVTGTGAMDVSKGSGVTQLTIASLASLKVLEAKLYRQKEETDEVGEGEGDGDVISGDVVGKRSAKWLTPRVNGAFGWNWLASELQPPLRWGETQRSASEAQHDNYLCFVPGRTVDGEAITAYKTID
ncbi:hypothetical protein, conserved [Trypanosoma brucei gambiense DAL972]|uniref:Leucine-rich repeat protein (LRRP) n=2 Tax=Trypanosoma brucei TaxID=5691 RepID=C9ZQC8_TRYB9|nr:hypothetical protein, conserved [Trypanosoma brucei gambiense DAL972]RHW72001.1 leucine-rich repeat protein (LRRP) [Trypanosoma brucei equiperdum]CBH11608.1 hypothetical protein, conserved [Trypanosoma brucei gambiense DAL972]|eukprot:XP_011773893.1 hypothetical protein, conserved [Trypanosoma brucei gambiense DAL972]